MHGANRNVWREYPLFEVLHCSLIPREQSHKQSNMLLILQLIVLLTLAKKAFALWPIPPHMTTGTTPLKLSPTFSITTSVTDLPRGLLAAINDTTTRSKTDIFQRLVVGRGAVDAKNIQRAPQLRQLELSLTGSVRSVADESTVSLTARSEEYTLSVPADGSDARLVANSTLGLFRGLTTFSQLWYAYGDEKYMLQAPVEIEDGPAFVSIPHTGTRS